MLFWILVAVMILVAVGSFAPAFLRKSAAAAALDRDQQNVVIAKERLAELEGELNDGVLDQAQFEQSKLELEQALLIDLGEERTSGPQVAPGRRSGLGALIGFGIFVPVMTLWIYFSIGSPDLIDGAKSPQVAAHGTGSEGAMPSLQEMLGALKARLAEEPNDSEGWFLLGRTYMAVDDYANAAKTYEKVYQLVGEQPAVMLALADAHAMAQAGEMRGRPAELVRKAVQMVPTDTTALWLAGIAEDQEGNHRAAIDYWNRLRPLLQGDAASLDRVDGLIARAMEKGNIETTGVAVPEPTVAAADKTIKVRVDLDPALRDGIGLEESVFVFARALSGPRMPLAAARHKVSDFPIDLTLDDNSAMAPQTRLSNFDQVLVGARVSRSGNPIVSSGDLTGQVSPVRPGSEAVVEVLINSRVP